ncbi:MAG: hypothetical protein PQJ59_17670 [Spirochaetales bacterium]|nr:hypothetical protein [Spirochaetales bacterium]
MAQHYATPWNILKESFIYYGKTFKFNALAVTAMYLPFFLTLSRLMQHMISSVEYEYMMDLKFWIWYGASMLYMLPAYIYFGYVMTRKVGLAYRGEEEPLSETLRLGLSNFFPLFLLSLLLTLGFLGGYLLLVVPGIILLLAWSLYQPVFVEEGLRGKAALKRSRQLTKGFKGEIFGVAFMLVMLLYIVMLVLGGIILTLSWNTLMTHPQPEEIFMTRRFWNGYTLFMGLFTILLIPFYFVIPSIFYFNLKKEKEPIETGLEPPRPNSPIGLY